MALRLCGLIYRLAVAVDQFGKHHQPLGRGANIVRGIAGDQGELRVIGGLDDADIFRHHDFFARYFISKGAAAAANLNLVALVEFIDMAEKSVTMGRDDRVSVLARLGGFLHVPGAFREFSPRSAFYDDCVHIDLGDHQAREHLVG